MLKYSRIIAVTGLRAHKPNLEGHACVWDLQCRATRLLGQLLT